MQVALMTPHQMWDARDAQAGAGRPDGLRDAALRMAEPAVEPVMRAAAPVVAKAVVEQAAARVAPQPSLRPAAIRTETAAPGRTIQLGAYSSEAGARAAWSRLKANADLSSLSPVFEGVEVNGRSLTRLKVGPIPAEAASALCQAAQVADPWCRRQG
jgi:cell division septation protein DedD